MGCITRTISYNFKTGETTILREVPSDREDQTEEILFEIFTRKCMEAFRKEQELNASRKGGDIENGKKEGYTCYKAEEGQER